MSDRLPDIKPKFDPGIRSIPKFLSKRNKNVSVAESNNIGLRLPVSCPGKSKMPHFVAAQDGERIENKEKNQEWINFALPALLFLKEMHLDPIPSLERLDVNLF